MLGRLSLSVSLGLTACSGAITPLDSTSGESGGSASSTGGGATTETTTETTGVTTSTTTGATGDGTGSTDATGFVTVDYGPEWDICEPGIESGAAVPGACPEGEKCSGVVEETGYCCIDTHACVPIIGDRQLGEACTREDDNDDCADGLFCMPSPSSGSTGPGVCMKFCHWNDADGCAELGTSATCVVSGSGILPLCWADCHPLLEDCNDGWGCYPLPNGLFGCWRPGEPVGTAPDGNDCYTLTSCDPRLVCIDGGSLGDCTSDACCTPLCNTSLPNPCSHPMEECVAWYEAGYAPSGYEEVGVCAVTP